MQVDFCSETLYVISVCHICLSDAVKGEYNGRTQEVASVTHYLNDNCTVNLPPFVTHSLDEVGVCIVPFVQ